MLTYRFEQTTDQLYDSISVCATGAGAGAPPPPKPDAATSVHNEREEAPVEARVLATNHRHQPENIFDCMSQPELPSPAPPFISKSAGCARFEDCRDIDIEVAVADGAKRGGQGGGELQVHMFPLLCTALR